MNERCSMIHEWFSKLEKLARSGIRNCGKDELYTYICTCACKIWSQNDKFSSSYLSALHACSGLKHDENQLRAAIKMAADPKFFALTPEFFEEMVKYDKRKGTEDCNLFIEALSKLLLEMAQINGDFTAAEASELSNIIDRLATYCVNNGLAVHVKQLNVYNLVTHLKENKFETK